MRTVRLGRVFDRGLEAMTDAGFEARMVRCPHSDLEPGSYEVFVGTKE